MKDFNAAMSLIRPSTSEAATNELSDWTKTYGAVS